jgi:hypothetical protein
LQSYSSNKRQHRQQKLPPRNKVKYLLVHFQSLSLLFYSASRKRTAALVAQEAEVNGEDQDSGREEEEEEEEDNLLPRRGKSKQRRIDSPSSSSDEEDPSGVRTLFANNEFATQEVPVFHQEENANEQPEDALDTSDEERSATRNQMDDEAGAGGIVFQDQQVSTSCG